MLGAYMDDLGLQPEDLETALGQIRPSIRSAALHVISFYIILTKNKTGKVGFQQVLIQHLIKKSQYFSCKTGAAGTGPSRRRLRPLQTPDENQK